MDPNARVLVAILGLAIPLDRVDLMARARTGVEIRPVRPPAPFENGPHDARARIAPEIQPSESL